MLESVPEEKRVYLDEAGIDNREDYPWAWCERGKRFQALKSGKSRERVSFVAALRGKELIAPLTFEGYWNRSAFESWVEQRLVPKLEVGQVVILDNAAFHKAGRIQKLIEGAGCQLLYLPPYSPDFNPIERCWSVLKNAMRQAIPKYEDFRESIDSVFRGPLPWKVS